MISKVTFGKEILKFINYSFSAETISKQLISKVIIHTSSSQNVPHIFVIDRDYSELKIKIYESSL